MSWPLPISPEALIALLIVVGFTMWTTFWEDRREARVVADKYIEEFDEDDTGFSDGSGEMRNAR